MTYPSFVTQIVGPGQNRHRRSLSSGVTRQHAVHHVHLEGAGWRRGWGGGGGAKQKRQKRCMERYALITIQHPFNHKADYIIIYII